MNQIYLDHNATSIVHQEVARSMISWLSPSSANASSVHSLGQRARRAVDCARESVARLLSVRPGEIIFTSGGTEANNLAVMGVVNGLKRSSARVIVSAIEHQSVLNVAEFLGRAGHAVSVAPVDSGGCIRRDVVARLLEGGADLVSVMMANNETGVIQPIGELSGLVHEAGALLHVDAVQAFGKIPLNLNQLGVDLASVSAHKLGGPQGSGALYCRNGVRLEPLFYGGRQERGLRPGTENVAAIVGFGKACDIVATTMAQDCLRMGLLRGKFESGLLSLLPDAVVLCAESQRLPNTSMFRFPGVDGEVLVINLDLMGLAASTGSACASAEREPSHVLTAMGLSVDDALTAVRFSTGHSTTQGDIDAAIDLVAQAVRLVRP